MPNWVPVATTVDCPPGTALEVVAGDRIVAVYNVQGEFFALDGVCPHQGGPLGKGCLKGHVVTCPWHGWQFDVRTGQHQFSPPIRQATLPIKVENGQVLVDVERRGG
jgi:nitrite reductase/ring-hydroxylating ferredoxin subunit